RASATAPAAPIAIPIPTSFAPSRNTSAKAEAGEAPSAIRTPLSRVRWATACATIPYTPTIASSSAGAANPASRDLPNHHRDVRLRPGDVAGRHIGADRAQPRGQRGSEDARVARSADHGDGRAERIDRIRPVDLRPRIDIQPEMPDVADYAENRDPRLLVAVR